MVVYSVYVQRELMTRVIVIRVQSALLNVYHLTMSVTTVRVYRDTAVNTVKSVSSH